MAARSKDTPANAIPAASGSVDIVIPDEVASKLEALRKVNAEAVQTLGNYFGPERWAKLVQRAERAGMKAEQIASLAGKLISTRTDWHPTNPAAALAGAACGFLCAIGCVPSPADERRYEDAKADVAKI